MKPAFSYYGGKQRMASKIMNLLPPQETYRGYCEPFCGGATLFWKRPFDKKCVNTLNDTNGSIINFFRVLRDPEQAMHLFRMLYFTPYSRDAHKEAKDLNAGRISEPIKGDVDKAWAWWNDVMQGHNQKSNNTFGHRKIKNSGASVKTTENFKQEISPDIAQAWAWWNGIMQVVSKDISGGFAYCLNGTSRNNASTVNNKKQEISPDIAQEFLYYFFQPMHQLVEISKYTERLKMVQLENIDALKCIQKYDTEHTLFYIDPPYPDTNQGHYKGYTQEDFEELVFLLKDIKGSFLLSCYPNDYADAYTKSEGWDRFTFDVVCSAAKNTREKRTEVIYRKLNENMKAKEIWT